MPLSIKAIDHLVIRVADLDAGEKLFTRLGFSLTPRGFHAGRGSANHTAPLSSGNSFELIYLPPGADMPFPERAEGPVALALASSDSRAVHAELTALGFDRAAPRARPSRALPEGVARGAFHQRSLPSDRSGGDRIFCLPTSDARSCLETRVGKTRQWRRARRRRDRRACEARRLARDLCTTLRRGGQ